MTTPDRPLVVDADRPRFRWPGAQADCLSLPGLQAGAGESVFVHGPSGCGKSTLLGLLAGVLLSAGGPVRLLGTDWATRSAAARDRLRVDHVGYIFQQFNLLPYLSVLDNVLLPCRFSAHRRERARAADGDERRAAERLLSGLGLGDGLWRRPAAALSVGQQQRVAAARALIGAPALVIADEPTSALDAATRDRFVALLHDACRAATSALIFVSHDAPLGARFDRRLDLAALNAALPSAAASEELA